VRKELEQKSADEGREGGGTAEEIAAQGGDPAIAAFIGGGGAGSGLNDQTPVESPAQETLRPAPDAERLPTGSTPDANGSASSPADADPAAMAQNTGNSHAPWCWSD